VFVRLTEAVTVETVWPSTEVTVQVEVPEALAPCASEAENVVVAEAGLLTVIPAREDQE
jgi:hypothetical protein